MKVFAVHFHEGYHVFVDVARVIGFKNAEILLSELVNSYKSTHAFETAVELSLSMSNRSFYNPNHIEGLDALIFELYMQIYHVITQAMKAIYNAVIDLPVEFYSVSTSKLYFTIYDHRSSTLNNFDVA